MAAAPHLSISSTTHHVARTATGVVYSPCPYCQTYGANTHSFHEIARTPRFGRIIYTCISKAEDYSNKNAIVTHITNTLDTEPMMGWSWVFDCRDLKMKHTLQLDIAVALSRGEVADDYYFKSNCGCGRDCKTCSTTVSPRICSVYAETERICS